MLKKYMLRFYVQDGSTNCQQDADCPLQEWDTCEDGPQGKVCGSIQDHAMASFTSIFYVEGERRKHIIGAVNTKADEKNKILS